MNTLKFERRIAEEVVVAEVGQTLKEIERDFIELTYATLNNNKTKTAKALGIGLRTLQRKLIKYRADDLVAKKFVVNQ